MATLQETVRVFGTPNGAAGVRITEKIGPSRLDDPSFGTVAFLVTTKRGPMGVPIPVNTRDGYDNVYGKPGDSRWGIYADGSSLGPDAIDGFFTEARGAGTAWILRNELDGKAKKADITLKSRADGIEVLRLTAANEGRWGGYKRILPTSSIIAATRNTFTIHAPNTEINEFIGAEVKFSANSKVYVVAANTETNDRGEVIFTLSPQFNLIADGISGPATLAGETVTYQPQNVLSGTFIYNYISIVTAISLNIVGDVATAANTASATLKTSFKEGQKVYYAGEWRTIVSIASNSAMTLDAPFSVAADELLGINLSKESVNITGTPASGFNLSGLVGPPAVPGELAVGDTIRFTVNGTDYTRKVVAINTTGSTMAIDTPLPDVSFTGQTISVDNYWAEYTGTNPLFVAVGSYLVDPYRRGDVLKVVALDTVATPYRFKVDRLFSEAFTSIQLTKSGTQASISLNPPDNAGLSVEVGQGIRYPATHFSLTFYFEGTRVFSIPDASLDPGDPYFVEPLVNDGNVAYSSNGRKYQSWVTAEVLWSGSYTTAPGSDIRPCNAAGIIRSVDRNKIYTDAELNYSVLPGKALYPDAYGNPRQSLRIVSSKEGKTLTGTVAVSTTTKKITGTGTNFTQELRPGDRISVEVSIGGSIQSEIRTIVSISSNTICYVEAAFPAGASPVSGLTVNRLGILEIDRGIDLSSYTTEESHFSVTYPETMTGGYDGDASNLVSYHYTRYLDIDSNIIERAAIGANQGLIRIAIPGINSIAVQKAAAAYAETFAYEFRVEIPSIITNPSVAESYINQEIGRNDFISVAFPSYAFVSNPLGGGERLVSIVGDILGEETFKARTYEGYHHPAAGADAVLGRVLRLPIEVTPKEEALLNTAGIQPIKTMFGNVVIFGGRCPAANPQYDFLHIRRIQSNYIRFFIEAREILQNLFKPNQPELSEQIILVLINYAQKEYEKGVFTRYLSFDTVVRIKSEASGTATSNSAGLSDVIATIVGGQLNIKWTYIPTGIVERFNITVSPDLAVSSYGSSNLS